MEKLISKLDMAVIKAKTALMAKKDEYSRHRKP